MLPALWAPLHHRPALAALSAFVGDTRPDTVVFLDAPDPGPGELWEAFTDVLHGFRAVYDGPITVCPTNDTTTGHTRHDTDLATLRVSVVPSLTALAPGWLAAPDNPMRADGGVIGAAQQAGSSLVSGATGRLRITGLAVPADGGGARVWLVFECGTLAEDRHAGTLGFGVLEDNRGDFKAYPVRVGADGSFTFHHTRYAAPAASPQPAGLRHVLHDRKHASANPRAGTRPGGAARPPTQQPATRATEHTASTLAGPTGTDAPGDQP